MIALPEFGEAELLAAVRGGGFTLLKDGDRVELTGEQLGEVINRLTTDDPKKVMPPPRVGQMPADVRLRTINEVLQK